MKKIFLFIAMAAIAISCSKENDSAPTPLVSTITLNYETQEDIIYTLIYDSSKRLTQMIRNGVTFDNTYTFSYDSNSRLTAIVKTGDTPGTRAFTYDSNGRLSSYTYDGTVTQITYTDGTYNMSGVEFVLNSNNDVAVFSAPVPYTFNYDTTKKGPFYNAKDSYQIFGVFMGEPGLLFIGKSPLDNVVSSTPQNNYAFSNTYNEDDYLTASSVMLGGNLYLSASYTYTE